MLKDKQKCLFQEFCGKKLELVKQTVMHPYEHMNAFEKFDEKKLTKKEIFFVTRWAC